DTLFDPTGPPVEFPPMPVFAPEFFRTAWSKDPSKAKQFRKGISQLDQEGVVQVLVSEHRGDGTPILAAVGPLQFEVAAFRMEHEFSAPIATERLSFGSARRATDADLPVLAGLNGVEIATRSDGVRLAMIRDKWRLASLRRDHPELELPPLEADPDADEL